MRIITKIYLINLIVLMFTVLVLAVVGATPEALELAGAWGGHTVFATPVWLVLLVLARR